MREPASAASVKGAQEFQLLGELAKGLALDIRRGGTGVATVGAMAKNRPGPGKG